LGTGDHVLLRPYFGLGENSIPTPLYSEIQTIISDSTEISPGYSLNYLYGSNADFGLDELEADSGTPFAHSQDDAVRSIYYNSGSYRTIASSSFFGAMADGSIGNTKAYVMGQYLNFLIDSTLPNIIASEYELDFGITYPDYEYTHQLVISNSGLDTLLITDINIAGEGFNYLGYTEFELANSEQQVLEIEFEIDEPGQYFGELTIFSNDSDTPELFIPLSSECILPPAIHCNPLFIDLTITSNQIHEGIMILSNIGESDLNCELAIIDSSQFAGWLEVSIDSCVIQPNDYEDILISFNPDGLEVGQYTAEIVIYHNDPSQDELIIPITMTLNYTNTEDNLTLVTNMLIGNYPNPFNPETTISFNLAQTSSPVTLEIFNLKGQRVREFKIENSKLKTNSIVWDGTDQTNNPVSSGIYFYKLKTENYEKTKRMVLLK